MCEITVKLAKTFPQGELEFEVRGEEHAISVHQYFSNNKEAFQYKLSEKKERRDASGIFYFFRVWVRNGDTREVIQRLLEEKPLEDVRFEW